MTKSRRIAVLVVAGGYVSAGVLMYRQRVMSGATLWNSDLFVFALPAAIAIVAFTGALWPGGAFDASVRFPRARAIALALFATAVSMWVCLSIAFARYGT